MSKSDCVFCNSSFELYEIKEYAYWSLQLFRDDQYYLGRCVAVLDSRHIVDITELTEDEREELFETVLPELQQSLDTISSPDMYNYASIGMDCSHFHLHIIPRYNTPTEFNGQVFKDEFWSQTYKQDYEPVQQNTTELLDLKSRIQDTL